ncbi:restriction endonuclease subunit S [Shewanella marina]|uniref:restriction endonuclease subunit S n=1 Tax=Shewanella marina TaxID=487319 RepID=UPI0035714200
MTSLNNKLKSVEWGEFKVGEFFEIYKTQGFNKNELVSGSNYDYITRTSGNQAYSKKQDSFLIEILIHLGCGV